MRLHLIEYALWLGSPVLQVGVLAFMYRRRLHHDYPYFFSYTILQVATVAFLFFAKQYSYTTYFFGYWVTQALSVIASFAVLQEIFNDAFRPYEALRDLSVILFRWSALVVLLVSGMWIITSSHSDHLGTFTTGVLLVERSVRLMQCGLVFFLLLFNEYLGIYRRHMLFGIAVGFGIFAAVNMLVLTALSHRTVVKHSVLMEINSAAYVVACMVWLHYAASPKSVRTLTAAQARSKDWNLALEDVRTPAAPESILDTMDRTVEQLLYPRETRKANAAASK